MAGKGGCIGQTASDSHALLHLAKGQTTGLRNAQQYLEQLTKHGMVEDADNGA